MTNLAFLFPGQGAQFVGMGLDYYEHYPEAKATFEQAATVLGPAFLEVIFTGPEEKLQLTEYTQPAILTVSVAIYRVLQKHGFKANGMAGLSLGEYSALVAAGSLSFEEALPLVQKRGMLMQKVVPVGKGSMVAIMGLPHSEVVKICNNVQEKGLVAPANYNCPGQIVLSGYLPALDKAIELARDAGAKKITWLKVSAPFHCELLKPVENELAEVLSKVQIQKPLVPIVFNTSAEFCHKAEHIKENLIHQVSNPIMWEQSIRTLLTFGVDTFIGLGPGDSLTRLMKRIDPKARAYSVENVEAIKKLGDNHLQRGDLYGISR